MSPRSIRTDIITGDSDGSTGWRPKNHQKTRGEIEKVALRDSEALQLWDLAVRAGFVDDDGKFIVDDLRQRVKSAVQDPPDDWPRDVPFCHGPRSAGKTHEVCSAGEPSNVPPAEGWLELLSARSMRELLQHSVEDAS